MSVQKTPISRTLPIYVRKRILDAINSQGMALPGTVFSVSGAIVTVDFDVISGLTLPGKVPIPLATSIYARVPIQSGDRGVCMPIDAYLGGVSGLGSARQTLTAQGNLTNLIWVPVGNKGWSAVDPNAYVLQGPNGVVLQDMDGKSVITLTPNGINMSSQGGEGITLDGAFNLTSDEPITLTVGSNSITISSSGVAITGTLTFNGQPFLEHIHTAVTAGTQLSGPVA